MEVKFTCKNVRFNLNETDTLPVEQLSQGLWRIELRAAERKGASLGPVVQSQIKLILG